MIITSKKEGTEIFPGTRTECAEKIMKRNLFTELSERFEAIAAEREGKITLRHYSIEMNAAPEVSAAELLDLRQRLNLSRAISARYLRINERTLENWEQGRSHPNAQAAFLIRMVKQYPDTVERLATI
ncbi:MAG: hypothetical protein L0H15_09400 [Nitrosospira sp.]|nr:hypothetical protein [Nitrosospira sp.]